MKIFVEYMGNTGLDCKMIDGIEAYCLKDNKLQVRRDWEWFTCYGDVQKVIEVKEINY